MDFSNFFHYQTQFNEKLALDKSLTQYKLTSRKYLELHIKLGYLANSTNCFKYLINTDTDICIKEILNKYINCLSNIISIGINNNYFISQVKITPNDYCLSDQFLNLYIDLNDLIVSSSEDHFKTLLEDFLSLGVTLGFSRNEIETSFVEKTFIKLAL